MTADERMAEMEDVLARARAAATAGTVARMFGEDGSREDATMARLLRELSGMAMAVATKEGN